MLQRYKKFQTSKKIKEKIFVIPISRHPDITKKRRRLITKAGLSKPREDEIKRFYYYRTVNRNGKEIYLNVAETDHRKRNGRWFHKRFLYSITRTINE